MRIMLIRRQERVKEMSSYISKIRQQWHVHVCLRDEDEDIRQVTNIQVGGRRKRGRPRQRWKDTVKSGMSRWGFAQEIYMTGSDGIFLLSLMPAERLPAKDAARWERWEKTWPTNDCQMYYEPWFEITPWLKREVQEVPLAYLFAMWSVITLK